MRKVISISLKEETAQKLEELKSRTGMRPNVSKICANALDDELDKLLGNKARTIDEVWN